MNVNLPLLPGERVVWVGKRGQPMRAPGGALGCRMVYAAVVLVMFVELALFGMMMVQQTRIYAVAANLLIIGAIVFYVQWRKRPAIFVTTQRLLERGLFGASGVSLGEIATYQRRVDTYYYRGSEEHVATNVLVLRSRSGGVRSVGPVLEYDDLSGLLDGIIGGQVDPTKMRPIDGAPAPAEERKDIFLAVQNWTGGDLYGPLFIGPRGLLRFTEKLPLGLEAELLTQLGQTHLSAEEIEAYVVQFARRPNAGHSTMFEISAIELGLEGSTLWFKIKERRDDILLEGPAALRARDFLAALRSKTPLA